MDNGMKWMRVIALTVVGLCGPLAEADEVEVLSLDVIEYEAFVQEDLEALGVLQRALHEKGIVGIRGIPGYRENVMRLIAAARAFSQLPEEAKEAYAPGPMETFLGYERGKEKFQRADGTWVVDDLKVSYYGFFPDSPLNKWPVEVDLRRPFEQLAQTLSTMGQAVMHKIKLLDVQCLEETPRVGRMLYYHKSENTVEGNPFWCGAHFDHSLFTALLPSFYFAEGQAIPEPAEAGLFVRVGLDGVFRKIVANDPDVLMFQVGEFGQLLSNDGIKATEHRVHKALGNVERYTMALFFDLPMETVIRSTSELTRDARYGAAKGEPCSYQHWTEATFKRYHVDKGEE